MADEFRRNIISFVAHNAARVGVLSGAFGGAALAVHLVPFVGKIAFLAPYAESVILCWSC